MGLGIRVATPLRVEKGDGSHSARQRHDARLRRAARTAQRSAATRPIGATTAARIDGQHVGMTIFCHPDNFRPSWFHARDYGFLAANPFGRAAFRKGEPSKVVVKPGEKLRLRYGILIHAERPRANARSRRRVPRLPATCQRSKLMRLARLRNELSRAARCAVLAAAFLGLCSTASSSA